MHPTQGVKRVVAVGAHPDDIEIGCMGTLLKLKDSAEIHLFVGCLGSPGDPSSVPARADESRHAFELLQPSSVEFRMVPGISHEVFEEVMKQLQGVLDRAQPDLILCHGPKDTHQEHRLMWEICLSAARRVRASIMHYGGASSTADFTPNVWVDISEQFEDKKRALARHKSQADKDYMNSPHVDIYHSNTYASLHGIRCSEAFELFRAFL